MRFMGFPFLHGFLSIKFSTLPIFSLPMVLTSGREGDWASRLWWLCSLATRFSMTSLFLQAVLQGHAAQCTWQKVQLRAPGVSPETGPCFSSLLAALLFQLTPTWLIPRPEPSRTPLLSPWASYLSRLVRILGCGRRGVTWCFSSSFRKEVGLDLFFPKQMQESLKVSGQGAQRDPLCAGPQD